MFIELHTTESAHKNAVHELERMRVQMEKMEEERTQMMAEVEAQIESALASMGMDLVDSDMDSHHGSERSVGSRSRSMSRRPSAASGSGRTFPPMRSFSTESTLAETVAEGTPYLNDSVIEEEAEESATMEDMKGKYQSPDAMAAVDEGIEDNSGRIAQKVMQIQQKVSSPPSVDYRLMLIDGMIYSLKTPLLLIYQGGHTIVKVKPLKQVTKGQPLSLIVPDIGRDRSPVRAFEPAAALYHPLKRHMLNLSQPSDARS